MLFAPKNKGYFVDRGEATVVLARTSSPRPPMVVEEVVEIAAGDEAALAEAIRRLQPKRHPSGYLTATVGIYPPRRLVRRATLEPKRLKEAGYLVEVANTQFRIEADKYALAVLQANDGSDFDPAKSTQKDVLFCGLPADDINDLQDRLLAGGIYPDRLELGSVAALGALVSLLGTGKSGVPTLVLEIGADATQSYIVSPDGVEAARPIAQGFESMVPVVQKELNLKDEESARKLFYSNAFDFTGMGPALLRKLVKELQSSIGFYEVQTGQSVGQVACLMLPGKLGWLQGSIASQLGLAPLALDLGGWLAARGITCAPTVAPVDGRWLGLFGLMAHYHGILPEAK